MENRSLEVVFPLLSKYLEVNAPHAKLGGVYDQRSNEFCITLYRSNSQKNTRYTLTEARGSSLTICFAKLEDFIRAK